MNLPIFQKISKLKDKNISMLSGNFFANKNSLFHISKPEDPILSFKGTLNYISGGHRLCVVRTQKEHLLIEGNSIRKLDKGRKFKILPIVYRLNQVDYTFDLICEVENKFPYSIKKVDKPYRKDLDAIKLRVNIHFFNLPKFIEESVKKHRISFNEALMLIRFVNLSKPEDIILIEEALKQGKLIDNINSKSVLQPTYLSKERSKNIYLKDYIVRFTKTKLIVYDKHSKRQLSVSKIKTLPFPIEKLNLNFLLYNQAIAIYKNKAYKLEVVEGKLTLKEVYEINFAVDNEHVSYPPSNFVSFPRYILMIGDNFMLSI